MPRAKVLKAINKLLAKKRSLAVINYLKGLGLKTTMIPNLVGAEQPISTIQAKNRRVELSFHF